MSVFDPQKMADLVAEESRIATELQTLSVGLNEQHENIKAHAADDAANATYMVGQQKHGQLTRELSSIRAQRDAYALREPTVALARKDAPLARWLRMALRTAWKPPSVKLYLGEISDAGSVPGGGGQTFVVKGAVASDDAPLARKPCKRKFRQSIIDKLVSLWRRGEEWLSSSQRVPVAIIKHHE